MSDEDNILPPPVPSSALPLPETAFSPSGHVPIAGPSKSISSVKLTPQQTHSHNIEELRALISGKLVRSSDFELALVRAVACNVPVDVLLIAEGLMDEQAFYKALAHAVGLIYVAGPELLPAIEDKAHYMQRFGQIFTHSIYGAAYAPVGLGPSAIRAEINQLRRDGFLPVPLDNNNALAITCPGEIRRRFQERFGGQLTIAARDGLYISAPEDCARGGLNFMQMAGLLLLCLLCGYGLYQSFLEGALAISGFFAVFFFFLIALRIAAVVKQRTLALLLGAQDTSIRIRENDLPIYTVLVPLFKETTVLRQLTEALSELDYPAVKLDIKILLEEVDCQTLEAVQAMNLPPYFDIVIVPDSQPRTKPKALNYGLQLALGSFVVIYDAEDIPEPDQLRRALQLFEQDAATGGRLATVQAKLNFYNPLRNWLTKQFTIEYSSLFDALLPCYFNLGFPIPLGGTSNHFRRDILEAVGGWDPYNVTEDADLGMRLYRRGYHSAILDSTTYEEACSGFKNWFFQRTRWLKGWMQTYYVHMRRPLRLWHELGPWKFLGFQAIIGGPIFSALAHPVFLGILIWQNPFASFPDDLALAGLWLLSIFNLSAGYLATMWLGLSALRARNISGLIFTIVTLPFYWLLISAAAYRGLCQLLYAPFYWEKTEHKGK